MTATSQHRTLAEERVYKSSVKYNHDKQFVEWGYRPAYGRSNVTYLIGFVCWLTGDDWFYVTVNAREFKVQLYSDGWAYTARTSEYDGPEDKINSNFDATRESALEGLIEKLQMAIEEGRI